MFFSIVLILLTLVYGYSGWRLIPHLPTPWSWATGFLLVGLALSPLLAVRMRESPRFARLGDLYCWAAYGGLGFFVLMTTFLLLRDAAGWALYLSGIPLPLSAANIDVATLGFTSLLALWGLYQARRTPAVRRIEVPIANLPHELDGLRIAQISDLHVGPTIKMDFVHRIVERVNHLEADLIVFTGDMADGPVERLAAHVAPLAQLSAPLGLFSITGNHEYYSDVHAWTDKARALGFQVLLNESRLVNYQGRTMAVVGITDHSAGEMVSEHRSDPQGALSRAPAADFVLLLAHQPRSIHHAQGAHLQLSGHTHGGQFFPWKYIVPLQQTYLAGLHRHDETWLYVHSGSGYWGPPLRLGAPSEIALLTLRRREQ
ncbi:MAG: putative MPP superfamily phosphohydrolase [Candidatus Latescibacterota bacterium]|jgi:predicted MPP superfamily phosphohydrolase